MPLLFRVILPRQHGLLRAYCNELASGQIVLITGQSFEGTTRVAYKYSAWPVFLRVIATYRCTEWDRRLCETSTTLVRWDTDKFRGFREKNLERINPALGKEAALQVCATHILLYINEKDATKNGFMDILECDIDTSPEGGDVHIKIVAKHGSEEERLVVTGVLPLLLELGAIYAPYKYYEIPLD